ncbi:RNA polymerase sigma factor SigJ [Paenibacillus sp. J5C_2022]|uniref:RNA polymerase sigma factor SigJ n=1 Tax=Paenibacillus sp. J5C2022 TaxID=2977129 RepID=UPI0021D170B2|nr:RNA polymerase sigma factor SigJ [Paenibacillus sp. J5C2022]MCU6708526.1 RNA polymerase sigma factor SigJ [Paenibacillus sp. J5C2022]
MDISPVYRQYYGLLHRLAYKMLGSYSDAEDMVQEVFARYYRLEEQDVRHEKAYLVRMVTNRCLNFIKSARKQREVYTGIWLPEPLVTAYTSSQEPGDRLERQEEMTYAMLIMLQELSGMERAVFLLKETLGYSYPDIAEATGKSEANCRKIFSRAKAKLGEGRREPALRVPNADAIVKAFMHASETGNKEALLELLAADVVMKNDGGGKVRTAIFPIMGKERVVALMCGIVPRGFLADGHMLVLVNGSPGVVIVKDGVAVTVLSFHMAADSRRIESIYMIKNPDKLEHVTIPDASLS